MAYGALAAGLAGLALAAALLTKEREVGRLDDPERAVAMLEGAGAPGQVPDLDQLWKVTTRGSRPTTEREKLSVQLGTYLVNLELAVDAGDTAAVRSLSTIVTPELDQAGIGGSAQATSIYRRLAEGPGIDVATADSLLAEAREGIRAVMDPEWLELGVWGQTARTAAARHDAGFFRSPDSRAALERIATLPLDDKAKGALTAVREVLPADGRIDWSPNDARWTTLSERLAGLLRETGR
jgi:hypothetical protein